MRRRKLRRITLWAVLAVALCCGPATAAEKAPWKIRRPADNTALPAEYVHRPGAGEALPGSGGAEEPPVTGDSAAPGTKPQAKAAPVQAAGKAPAASPGKPAPQAAHKPAPRANLGRAGALESSEIPRGVVLFLPLDRKAAAPRSHRLREPARLVFDLPGAWGNVGPNVYRVDSPLVEKVVLGEHDDFLRLVIYFTGAAAGLDPVAKASFSPDGLRLELTVK